jgi:hypothetical protein
MRTPSPCALWACMVIASPWSPVTAMYV